MKPSDHSPSIISAWVGSCRRIFVRHQFVRFVLVGVGNTAFSYGAYALLLLVGLEYRIASLLALLLGIAFSFVTQGTVVFRNATRATFAKFVLAWALLYLLNISIIALLMRVPMSAYLAGALATVPITLTSFLVLKLFVFAQRKTLPPTPAAK